MDSLLVHWSTFANASFWALLIALDVWVLRRFALFRYGSSTVTAALRPYLKTQLDLFLWILIYIWFIALVLLETYSLFTIWAGCFVSCLDNRMRNQDTAGRVWFWTLLLGLPSVLLMAVVIGLAFACASLCELVCWNQEWSAEEQLAGDEEKGFLVAYTDEKRAVEVLQREVEQPEEQAQQKE